MREVGCRILPGRCRPGQNIRGERFLAGRIRLTGIKRVTKPDGRVYVYRRIRGKLVPLPNLPPNHPDFLRAYIEAEEVAPRDDSLAALIDFFLASPDFKARKASTRTVWRRRLIAMQVLYGKSPVAKLQTTHIEKALRKLGPGAARSERTIWRAVMAYAKAEGWRKDNPAKDAEIRAGKTKPHPAWSSEDLKTFRARWPAGTPERQAVEVLQWTGARCVDAVRIGWHQVGPDGVLEFVQEKTGGAAVVPIKAKVAPFLAADLAAFLAVAGGDLFLAKRGGGQRSPWALSNMVASAAREAGLTGRTAHGLRKYRAVMLAENGWTPHQIGAWTGHESLQEVTEYTRAASKRALILGGG